MGVGQWGVHWSCKEDPVLTGPVQAAANLTAQGAQIKAPSEPLTSENILAAVLASLDDDKAEDVVQIDLRGKSSMADAMVIATGR